MEQREGRRRRIERLARQMQHDRAVLADRIEHHRALGLGDHFAQDVDALGLEALKMSEARGCERFARTSLLRPAGHVTDMQHDADLGNRGRRRDLVIV